MTLSTLARDIRYSLRLLWRTPGVTSVALLTLALGIGANTAIFSVVDGVLLRPLAYPRSDRLYLIRHADIRDPGQISVVSPGNFYDLQHGSRLVQRMAAYSSAEATLTGRGEPERLQGLEMLGSVLEVVGVQPILGRTLTEADDRPGAPRAVVISYELWQRLFGGGMDALGQALTLAGRPYTVVGVMPRGFRFPQVQIDFWAPAQLSPQERASRTEQYLSVVGRLADGATPAAARAEADAIMARMRTAFPEANGTYAIDVRPLRDALVANVSRLLWILMAGVGCVLLIACANLANLLLAKATRRGREMAIRQAIGASRGRLVRQLLVESVVLSAIGGAAGVLAASLFLSALVAWLPPGIPRLGEAAIDARVLLFAGTATIATGIVFGLAPALQLARTAPASQLRDDNRTASGRSRLRKALVAGELAIAVVLLAGAGLLIRSFAHLLQVDPGFAADRLLTFQVRLEGATYATGAARTRFVEGVVERLKSLPGAADAAAASYAPIVGRGTAAWFNMIAKPWPKGTTPPAVPYRVVTTDYFRTLGIPLVRGRVLRDSDGLSGSPSVVISESVARRFWPGAGEDPIGSEIYLGASDYRLFDRATVVGIVKDVKLSDPGSALTDAVYGLTTLMPWWRNFTFTVRTSGDPAALASAARTIVRDTDPSLAVTRLQAMSDIMRTSVAPTRASMLLISLFAAVAMIMAAIGVFGVMSYTVSQRVREMGIRLALGAKPSELKRMVVRDGMTQALAGVVLGLGGAAWLTRTMSSMLFEVRPGDPLTLAAVALVLLAIAALACYIPARRATRVDPLVVLRAE
jgi:putative ABC transport system permease protein